MLYIFDWDGTVSDSAAKIVSCMQSAARDCHVEVLDAETVKNIIGLGLPQAVATLYPQLDDAKREDIAKGYSQHFVIEDKRAPSPLFPNALTTMKHLVEQGFRVAVATGKSRRGLDRILKQHGLDNFFHATRCADETASKPDPMMLQELLDELGLPAQKAVMIGDTEYDMAMAEAIAMPRIAVSFGAHHIDRLKKYQPALCVDKFEEINVFEF